MKKSEIKAKLDKLRIKYSPDALKNELQEILDTESDKVTTKEKKVVQSAGIEVVDKDGNVVQIFSKERQGKDYRNLAQKFADNRQDLAIK